jgi:putrescine transport system permease protein
MMAAIASGKRIDWGRIGVIAVPYLWLTVFFLLPLLIVLKLSFSQVATSIPPYTPQLNLAEGWDGVTAFFSELTRENYQRFFTPDPLDYIDYEIIPYLWTAELPINGAAYISSVKIALVSTFFVLLIGYPLAYGMSKAPKAWRPLLLVLVILPFFTSLLIRVYAWMAILKPEGLLNLALSYIGLVDFSIDAAGNRSLINPYQIDNSEIAVVIGIVYSYLPFMVLPLYAVLEKMDDTLIEAAQDLGCTRFSAFWRVTFPLSMTGIVAGSMLVFIPAIGEYVVPELLGGADSLMIGRQLVNEYEKNRDWPYAAAFAILLLIILIVPIVIYQSQQAKQIEAGR